MRPPAYGRTSAAQTKERLDGLPSLHTERARTDLMISKAPLADMRRPRPTLPRTARTKTPAGESNRSDDWDLAYKSRLRPVRRSPARSSDPGAMNRSTERQFRPKEMRTSRQRRTSLCTWQVRTAGFVWQ